MKTTGPIYLLPETIPFALLCTMLSGPEGAADTKGKMCDISNISQETYGVGAIRRCLFISFTPSVRWCVVEVWKPGVCEVPHPLGLSR